MLKSLGLHFFQNGTSIFQMGLLFLEKEESRTPTFEIQVRTLEYTFSVTLCSIIRVKMACLLHNKTNYLVSSLLH